MPPLAAGLAAVGGLVGGGAAAGALMVGSAGAAAYGAHKNSSAIKKASAASQQAADANNALQRDIYSKNTTNLAPFMQRGNVAGDRINALLGLGGDANAARTAFDQFRGSTGYDFRMGQGVDAINQNNVTSGLLKSGKSLKDLTTFGQGIGSQEFGNYLGYLSGQQGVGLSGANALAGVGTNYANAVGANNTANANTQGNAAIAGANNTNALIGNILGAGAYLYGNRGSSYSAPKLPSSVLV